MNRRRFLAGATGALPALFAGCINSASNADDGADDDSDDGSSDGDDNSDRGGDDDTVPVLTDYEVSDHVAVPDAERTSDTDAWGLFVASADAAERYYSDVEDDVAAFVEDTDFEAGDRLVFLQAYAPQTCYELVLDGEPHVSTNGIPTVEAAVERTASEDEPCGDAMTAVEVLLRLSFDLEASSTDVLEAEIGGHQDEPEELTLEAER